MSNGGAAFVESTLQHIDGNWIDIASVLLSVAYVWNKWRKQPKETRCPFVCREMGVEFVNGASLFPLAMLACSVFSTKITEALMSGSRVTLSVAGCFALFALLDNRALAEQGKGKMAGEFVAIEIPPAANSPPPSVAPGRRAQPTRNAAAKQPKRRAKANRS